MRGEPIEVRFWSKVQKTESGCWLWTASSVRGGYGKFSIGGGLVERAHRYAYRMFRGPIPPDLELDHLCGVTACVNPEHLEAVTHQENTRRGQGAAGQNARKTHCKRGHLFGPENTYHDPAGDRRCRICLTETHRQWCQTHDLTPTQKARKVVKERERVARLRGAR